MKAGYIAVAVFLMFSITLSLNLLAEMRLHSLDALVESDLTKVFVTSRSIRMPIKIITQRKGRRNIYIRIDTNEYYEEVLRRTCYLEVIETIHDGHTVFSLLDENGQTNSLFHKYINETMMLNHRSVNSRRKYAQVICKFYSFIELMGYSEYALEYDEIHQLRTFLVGTGHTACSNETVNSYLAIIREFFISSNINCEVLFSKHSVFVDDGSGFGPQAQYKYDINLSLNTHRDEHTPRYISMSQYIVLVEIAQSRGDWNGVMLMHLMYRYGMRIGECLGLTDEDFITTRIKGKDVPTLILRNRLSDKAWQHAKGRFIPRQKNDYEGSTYTDQWRNDEYSHIYLTESSDFVDAFMKFIRESRKEAELNHSENYCTCEADIVCPHTFRLEKNHYLFVNRFGKCMSAQLWGNQLKQYFVEANITLDTDKRHNNLSHRFRHGYAMMHAHFMQPQTPMQVLQKMMRHKRLSSTIIYYNPTLEDEYEYKTSFQNSFYDNNPRLDAVIKDFLR